MNHPVVHFEIGCKDKAATSAFYASAFGWAIESGPMGGIQTGSADGIQGHIAALGHEPHQFTHFYVQTDDVAQTLAQIEGLGGKTIVPAGGNSHRHLCVVRGPRRAMWWACGSRRKIRATPR